MSAWKSLRARFAKQPPFAKDQGDASLLAPYRRKPLGWPAQLVLYATIAGAFFLYGFAYGVTAPFQMMLMTVPIFVLALLIVWALPPGEYAPWRTLEPLYLAFFTALVLWPVYLAIALPNLPWITLVRLFATPLAFVLLICVSASKTFRKQLSEIIASDSWIWRLLIAWVVMQSISIFISSDPNLSVNKYIIFQLYWTSIFVVSCFLFNRVGFADRWTKMFIAMGYVICFYGLWEVRLGLLPWAGHIPAFLRIEDESVIRLLAGVVRSAKGIHRVQSSATTPLGMSELLGLMAPFALHLAVTSRSIFIKVVSIVFLPLALQLVLLADSRLGMVALIGAVLGYVLIWGALRWRRSPHSLFAPALVLAYPAIFSVTITATLVIGRIRNRVWGSGASASSTESRGLQWDMAIPKIATHPFGHGIGRAARDLGFVSPSGIITIDSYYLTLLMDLGVLGFVIYFAMFLRGVWISARAVIQSRVEGELGLLLPMCVALMNFVVVKSVFSQDANHPIVFMMLGAVVAMAHRAAVAAKAEGSRAGASRERTVGSLTPAYQLKSR
jgi:O-Antigen ligase